MRAVRLLSIVIAGLLGLALLAAWQVPGRLDWNRYRETIEALASARLGRPVTIAGPITLSLLPETELTAADVVVAAGTSPGASLGASGDGPAGPALTVKALRLRVAPLPLLSGRVDARELALSGADLTVEWPLRRGELAGWPPYWLSAFSARIEKSRLRIGGLTLDNIDATLETTDTGGLVAVGIGRVGGAGGQPIRLTARMTATGIDGAAGLNLAVEATDRSPGASAPGTTGGFAGGLVAGFAGQLAGDGGLAGRIDLSGSDLSQLVAAPAGSVPGGSVPGGSLPGGGFKAGAAVKAAGDLASFDDLTIDVDGPNGPSALRGAATLRLAPDLRLEAKLSAARLELDPFLSLLARMGGPGLTIGLQLQAEAVAFGGGLMRELSAALEVTPAQITLHEVAVRLPGEADLRLAGVVQRGDPNRPRFEGDVRLAAPRLREMLRWLDGAGLRLLPDLPEAVLTSTDFRAHAVVEPGLLALDRIDGQLDGTAVTGELRLWPRVAKPAGVPAGVGGNGAAGASGNRPAIVASLELGNLQLDPWLPDLWPNFGDGVLGFDVDLRLRAPSARLRGEEITALSLDAAVHSSVQGASAPIASGPIASGPIASGQLPQAPVALAQGAGVQGGGQGGAPPLASLGRVTLRQLEATLRGVRLVASGTVGEGGRLTEGKLQASTDDASALAGLLAPEWRPAAGFWRGPAALSAQLAGPAEALGLKLALDMANARLEAQPVIDLRSGKWAGPVTLRHPGAPRLLGLLGLPRAEAWLGEGSLSVIAQLSGGQLSGGQLLGGQASAGEGSGSGALGSGALGSGGRFSAELRDVTAGLLRLSASLALDASGEVPLLTGRIQADTLALPEPAWRDATPLPFALLRGWRASVPITARQVLVEREPRLMQAAGMISLGDGVLRLDPFGAVLAGGALGFTLVANAAMDPPVLAVSATLADATLDVPPDAAAEAPSGAREPGGLPLDLLAGRANLGLELSADGHSPAAMLATLSGGITLNVERGALSGFDLARVMRTVASADPRTRPATETALREAMVEGVTNFDRLEIRAEARSGTLVLQEGALTGSAGTAEFSGSVGLGARVLDLRVALRPAIEAPPEIAVRLTGPWAKPRRSPELAGFLRWLADRNSPTP